MYKVLYVPATAVTLNRSTISDARDEAKGKEEATKADTYDAENELNAFVLSVKLEAEELCKDELCNTIDQGVEFVADSTSLGRFGITLDDLITRVKSV